MRLPPSVLPDISPTRGEIDKRLAPCSWNERVRHLISPLVGEMPGRAEGGILGCCRHRQHFKC
ncbi:diaminohydroxyphosphoribosylaminopyrimidine deaminase [Rhizobium rhizogenes]|uniref:Diaminohydroxyphosphoribosylaminopyrimidine deaminase n=1 Tax=Rhizobium rhizogenes TaxID=359 RepID=A0AA88EZD2_RHIRH|nr:diaminohydroxyphosphoribosylaminopyrimidine deaminase [Rhizobium rhizogenes]MQB12745.1 diaminohydroxyphosphoribosylaminopyrimidine deaminase [Agrobacterium sp. ICMP 6402]